MGTDLEMSDNFLCSLYTWKIWKTKKSEVTNLPFRKRVKQPFGGRCKKILISLEPASSAEYVSGHLSL